DRGGISKALLRRESPHNIRHIQANPKVPPNDAAAAQNATRIIPTGFNAPATQERTPPVKYGTRVSFFARCNRSGSAWPRNGRISRSAIHTKIRYEPTPSIVKPTRQSHAG